jgi:hypothetical protein
MLGIAAIVYFAIQWIGTSTIARNKIFSRSRRSDRASFALMLVAISDVAHRECGSDKANEILFDDRDVATPYVIDAQDGLAGCRLVRETVVTPFTRAEMEGCNELMAVEFSPEYPFAGSVAPGESVARDQGPRSPHWVEIKQWVSTDARFGFQLYRSSC